MDYKDLDKLYKNYINNPENYIISSSNFKVYNLSFQEYLEDKGIYLTPEDMFNLKRIIE